MTPWEEKYLLPLCAIMMLILLAVGYIHYGGTEIV